MSKNLFNLLAGADSCSAMEAETIQKNAVSPKNLRSRRNLLKMTFLSYLMICLSASLQAQYSLETQKEFAENIYVTDPSIQADLHKKYLDTKNEELQIIVSSNINKYDKSARSEAYKASVATGNPKVIAAANASLDKVNWEGVDKSLKVNSNTATTSSTQSTTTPSTTNSQPPSGNIENVWLEFNVYKNGEYGMNIHIHFTINNMKGKTGVICADIDIKDNNDKNITSQCSGGPAADIAPSIKPSYDNSEYKDYVIFISYSRSGFQSLPRGTTDLKISFVLYSLDDSVSLDRYNNVFFTFSK